MTWRSPWIAVLVGAAVVGSAAPADAAEQMPGWGAEIRLGPYQPRMGNLKEQEYYGDFFKDRSPLLKALEFERYLYDFYGMVGVFARVGHWKVSGHSIRCVDAAGDYVECGDVDATGSESAPDVSAMIIVPLSMGAIYRFTYLKTKLQIPLMFYAKAGLDYYLWWISANGETAQFPSDKATGETEAKGATTGFHVAAGVALNLDWIEGGSSGRKSFLDSYLFVEGKWTKANGFGNRAKPDMSASQVVFGLAFDFE